MHLHFLLHVLHNYMPKIRNSRSNKPLTDSSPILRLQMSHECRDMYVMKLKKIENINIDKIDNEQNTVS